MWRWIERLRGREPVPDLVQDAVTGLFAEHGVPDLARYGCRVEAELVDPAERRCRLDVRLFLPDGNVIVECFAGMGADRQSTIRDALENFTRSSFHVLLRGLIVEEPDEQVHVEQWIIGDRTYRVTLGNVTARGNFQPGSTSWVETFENVIRGGELTEELSWIRLYYAHRNREAIAVEVLRNNEEWESAQTQMAAAEWPESEAFYSVRVFLVLRRVG